MRVTKFFLLGTLIVHLEVPARIQAQNAIWNGGTGGWFDAPSNWVCVSGVIASPCAAPNGSNASATIGTIFSGSPISGTVGLSAPLSLNSLTVGNGVAGTLNISSASATASVSQLSVGAQGVINISSGASLLGSTNNNAGSITVSGPTSLFSGTYYNSSGNGAMLIQNGGQASYFLASFAGGPGTSATISSAGSTLNTNGMEVGGISSGQQGSMIIQNGGHVTANAGTDIGLYAGATGAVTVTGAESVWTVNDDLAIGTHGGNGSLSILHGGSVGPSTAGTLGTVVGSGSGSVGFLLVGSGGNLDTGQLTIGGNGGTGSVIVQNSGTVYGVGNGLEIAQNGTLELDSGSSLSAYPEFGLDAGGTLKFGIESSTGYPNIEMENALATFDGTIDFDFMDGFEPVAGETFELIAPTFANTNYNTAAFEVQGLASGFQYELLTQNGGLSLEALDNGVSTTATAGTPEPGSLWLIGAGFAMCGLMIGWRRFCGRSAIAKS